VAEQKRTKNKSVAKPKPKPKKRKKKTTKPSVIKTNKIKKNRMIKALEKNLGVVTKACKKAKVCRTAFYEWCREDPEFKKRVDDVGEQTKDFVEGQNYKLIKSLHPAAIMFYLKTKCRDRGYKEKAEIVHGGSLNVDVTKLTDQQLGDLLMGKEIPELMKKDESES
jgi:hypothetical protein